MSTHWGWVWGRGDTSWAVTRQRCWVFPQGDLKQFLRISKSKDEKLKSQPLSTKQKVRMVGVGGREPGGLLAGALVERCLRARPRGEHSGSTVILWDGVTSLQWVETLRLRWAK